jgi:hypothetical protein
MQAPPYKLHSAAVWQVVSLNSFPQYDALDVCFLQARALSTRWSLGLTGPAQDAGASATAGTACSWRSSWGACREGLGLGVSVQSSRGLATSVRC